VCHFFFLSQQILGLEKAAREAQSAVSHAWSEVQEASTNRWKKFADHVKSVLINLQPRNDTVTACAQWYGFGTDTRRKTRVTTDEYCGVRGIVRKKLEVRKILEVNHENDEDVQKI